LPGPRESLRLITRFNQLVKLALERQPDVIICVDYQGFNSYFAKVIKRRLRARSGPFNNWNPKIIKYISPQVWASREGRARKIARDFDLVLSIIPFEKDWYASRVPELRVEFVGHPLMDRYGHVKPSAPGAELLDAPNVLLLPASRKAELERHWPVMLAAWQKIQAAIPSARAKAVLPNETLAAMARSVPGQPLEIQVGGLADALTKADVAISKTGTISLECAFFRVPTVTMYIASVVTYQGGKRLAKVKSLTMPNLIANEEVFPEFIQHAATPENISHAALQLLRSKPRREKVQAQIAQVVAKLGTPGASRRAAEAILGLMR
jgi:lipid-A-disaccharide synthase